MSARDRATRAELEHEALRDGHGSLGGLALRGGARLAATGHTVPRGAQRTLVCVVAHPDDDAHAVAGSVALHAEEADFRFVLVHATHGELGDIREGFPATRETLAAVRQAEDEAAWRALGRVPDRHEWLGLPDGRVSSLPFNDVVAMVERILVEEQPAVVATFGPDGISGHPDHVTIGGRPTRLLPESAVGEGPGCSG